ncbi:SDR family NAD(P)-dependent oxidoreductase, partial [Octadecabacter sp.]|nr:SDR family NAD(P)-dependent oxidoreductase [Octadecabacter sp.]
MKTALITGASRGLGAALADALAPTHHIIALGRTTGALEDLDDRIKAVQGEATLAPMDITVDAA